jgi:hypothetical protein
MPFTDWLEGEVTHTIVRLLQHLTKKMGYKPRPLGRLFLVSNIFLQNF